MRRHPAICSMHHRNTDFVSTPRFVFQHDVLVNYVSTASSGTFPQSKFPLRSNLKRNAVAAKRVSYTASAILARQCRRTKLRLWCQIVDHQLYTDEMKCPAIRPQCATTSLQNVLSQKSVRVRCRCEQDYEAVSGTVVFSLTQLIHQADGVSTKARWKEYRRLQNNPAETSISRHGSRMQATIWPLHCRCRHPYCTTARGKIETCQYSMLDSKGVPVRILLGWVRQIPDMYRNKFPRKSGGDSAEYVYSSGNRDPTPITRADTPAFEYNPHIRFNMYNYGYCRPLVVNLMRVIIQMTRISTTVLDAGVSDNLGIGC